MSIVTSLPEERLLAMHSTKPKASLLTALALGASLALSVSACEQPDCSGTLSSCESAPMTIRVRPVDQEEGPGDLEQGDWTIGVSTEEGDFEWVCSVGNTNVDCGFGEANVSVGVQRGEISFRAWNASYPQWPAVQILPERFSMTIRSPSGITRGQSWTFEPDHEGAADCVQCQFHDETLVLEEIDEL